jgi:hypothetical protein
VLVATHTVSTRECEVLLADAYLFVDETGNFKQPEADVVLVGCLARKDARARQQAFVSPLLHQLFPFADHTMHGWLLKEPVWILARLAIFAHKVRQRLDDVGPLDSAVAAESLSGQDPLSLTSEELGRLQAWDAQGLSKSALQSALVAAAIGRDSWWQNLDWSKLLTLSKAAASGNPEVQKIWQLLLGSLSTTAEPKDLKSQLQVVAMELRRSPQWLYLASLTDAIGSASNKALAVLLPAGRSFGSSGGHAWLATAYAKGEDRKAASAWLEALSSLARDAHHLATSANLASVELVPLVPHFLWFQCDGDEAKVRAVLSAALPPGGTFKLTAMPLGRNADTATQPGLLIADWLALRSGVLTRNGFGWTEVKQRLASSGVWEAETATRCGPWPHASALLTDTLAPTWPWVQEARLARTVAEVTQ